MYAFHSLVPRPFPPPVLDLLAVYKYRGGSLGDLVTCGDDAYIDGR